MLLRDHPRPVETAGPVRRARVFVAPTTGRGGAAPVTAGIAGVVAGTVVSLLRQSGVAATNTIWAEDGTLFLADAVTRPLSLFESYNGYFLVGPRLIATVVAWFPAEWAAPLMAVSAAAVNSLFALVVYVASAGVLRSPALRVAVAAVAVITPAGGYEVPNSLANLQWAGLYALFWVVLWVPTGRAGRRAAAATALGVSTMSFLAVVLVPLVAVRLLVRRDRASALIALGLGGGVVLQLFGLLLGASRREGVAVDLAEATGWFFGRVLPVAAGGERLVGNVSVALEPLPAILAWCALLLVVVAGVLRRRQANWAVAGLALLYALVFWLATAGVTGISSTRYSTTAVMLVVAALAALLAPDDRGGPARSWVSSPGPAAVFGAAVLVVCLVSLRQDIGRPEGPGWSSAVERARASCARIGPGMLVYVPISPPSWRARLPCTYLQR